MNRNLSQRPHYAQYWRQKRAAWRMLCGSLGFSALACSNDAAGPAPGSANQGYWALKLNYHAINLALVPGPGQPNAGTAQLRAVALTAAGDTLQNIGTIRYFDPDSSVTVTPTGLVTAHYPVSRTVVAASLTSQGITLTDSAVIQVTQSPFPAPLATFSIQPLPLDLGSAESPQDVVFLMNNGNGNIPAYATDAQGDSLCSADLSCQLTVSYSSSDPTIADLSQYGEIQVTRPGHVTFYATTFAYGVFKQDSLPFVLDWPSFRSIYVQARSQTGIGNSPMFFYPQSATISAGGEIAFQSQSHIPIDIEFDDSTDVAGVIGGRSGNITQFCDTCTRDHGYRIFPKKGVYTFHSRQADAGGTIVVSSAP